MNNKILPTLPLMMIALIITALTSYHADAQSQQQYPGTNTRGKVVINEPAKNFPPMTYVKVDLYQFEPVEQKWTLIASTYTDQDGFYFYNYIRPGNYSIQVNEKKNYEVTIVQIDYTQTKYQDLPMLYY